MSNLKKLLEIARRQGLTPNLNAHSEVPRSRRELIARGFIRGTGFVMTPSLLALLSNRSYAAECGPGLADFKPDPNSPRLFAFEAAGGMGMAANFAVFGPGGVGDLLPSRAYGVLGIPQSQVGPDMVDMSFGIPLVKQGGVLEGLLAATTPEARSRCAGGMINTMSNDDSSTNPFCAGYWAFKAGATGALSHLIGNESSPQGARSLAPSESVISSVSATRVASYANARDLVSASVLNNAVPGGVGEVLRAARMLSESQMGVFSDKQLPDQLETLVKCHFVTAETAASAKSLADGVDASKDQALLAALTAATTASPSGFTVTQNELETTTSQAYLLMKGYAGYATRVMGGRDYHNNPRADTNNLDFNYGFNIGRSIQIAHHLGVSCCFFLYSDGATGCSNPDTPDSNATQAKGQGRFTSDRGVGSTIAMIAYHPKGKPQIVHPKGQINAFNPNGGVHQDFDEGKIVANSVVSATQAVILNLLALQGRIGDIDKVLGNSHPFKGIIDKYVLFGPWPK